jgi:hypothetical protein
MTVRDGSHIFHLGKRAGLHYSNFSDRHLVFMRIGGPSYLKICRFLPRVEKDGLVRGCEWAREQPWKMLLRAFPRAQSGWRVLFRNSSVSVGARYFQKDQPRFFVPGGQGTEQSHALSGEESSGTTFSITHEELLA